MPGIVIDVVFCGLSVAAFDRVDGSLPVRFFRPLLRRPLHTLGLVLGLWLVGLLGLGALGYAFVGPDVMFGTIPLPGVYYLPAALFLVGPVLLREAGLAWIYRSTEADDAPSSGASR